MPQNAPDCISEHLTFNNFPGEHAPGPPWDVCITKDRKTNPSEHNGITNVLILDTERKLLPQINLMGLNKLVLRTGWDFNVVAGEAQCT